VSGPALLLRRLVGYAWDNPTAEHDARSILSAHKIGLWLGVEVLLIAIVAAIALFAAPEERELREVMVRLGTGPWLIFCTLGTLALFLTLVVPLRAVGLLDGPRWRGYLDQVITTGITPLRYHAGKWATSQPFFLALLGASLPFVTLFGLLGGATLGHTVLAYVVLYAYANLLLLVTMALGVLVHEGLALVGTLALFALLMIVDLYPAPSSLACFTPVRFLIQPIASALSATPAIERLYGAPHPFGVELPWAVWALGLWAFVGGLCLLTLMLGPLHGFPPGLNNFGGVVLPGDGARAFFRRMRPFVARRVELAFLFENRGPRLVRLTLPLRWLQQVALGLLATTLILSVTFDPEVVRMIRWAPELVAWVQVSAGLPLVLVLFLLRGGWAHSMARCPIGGLRVPLLVFDLGAFFVVAAALIALHTVGFALVWADLGQLKGTLSSSWSERTISADELFAASSNILNAQVVTALIGLLIMKVLGTRVLSEDQAFFGTAAFLLALIILPLFPLAGALGLARSPEVPEVARSFAPTVFFFGLLSPASHVMVATNNVSRELRLPVADHWLLANGFWLWSGAFIAFLSTYAWAGHRALWREAALLERLGDVDAPKPAADTPPCGACGCQLASPVAFTSWGGLVGTGLLGVVRCLDCRVEFQRSTGRPPGLARLAVLAARGLVVVAVCVALLLAVHTLLSPGAP
jgi:hypothetical protein